MVNRDRTISSKSFSKFFFIVIRNDEFSLMHIQVERQQNCDLKKTFIRISFFDDVVYVTNVPSMFNIYYLQYALRSLAFSWSLYLIILCIRNFLCINYLFLRWSAVYLFRSKWHLTKFSLIHLILRKSSDEWWNFHQPPLKIVLHLRYYLRLQKGFYHLYSQ